MASVQIISILKLDQIFTTIQIKIGLHKARLEKGVYRLTVLNVPYTKALEINRSIRIPKTNVKIESIFNEPL